MNLILLIIISKIASSYCRFRAFLNYFLQIYSYTGFGQLIKMSFQSRFVSFITKIVSHKSIPSLKKNICFSKPHGEIEHRNPEHSKFNLSVESCLEKSFLIISINVLFLIISVEVGQTSVFFFKFINFFLFSKSVSHALLRYSVNFLLLNTD